MDTGQVGHEIATEANDASVIKVQGQGLPHGVANASVMR
jgi:hypothetical protein